MRPNPVPEQHLSWLQTQKKTLCRRLYAMVEKTMLNELSITADPERLDEGSVEERACFAAIAIKSGIISLAEGHDSFVNKVRAAPLLSAYHLAEWMAWHWWRLRWEPRSSSPGWDFAHRLATVGEGYVWPNITVFSDWERVALVAKPTRERPNTPFRYLSDATVVVGARELATSWTSSSSKFEACCAMREWKIPTLIEFGLTWVKSALTPIWGTSECSKRSWAMTRTDQTMRR